MAGKTVKHFGISLGLLGTMLIATTMFAQESESANRLAIAHTTPLDAVRAHAQAMAHDRAQAAGLSQAAGVSQAAAPSYDYTLISYPGTLNTQGVGMNPGAIHWGGERPGIEIVGAEYFPDGLSQTGFRAHISKTRGFTENYKPLNDPESPSSSSPQQTYGVNDFGVTVGDYFDISTNIFHSYVVDCGNERGCDPFKALEVPFAGAMGTYSPAINNAGEIVGSWNDSAGNAHGYTLIAGKFESFDFPGAGDTAYVLYYGINSEGEIAGSYVDKSGNTHGFLRKGKSYTSIDFPGAFSTAATGINDAGDIVGQYCPTSACANPNDPNYQVGTLGFLRRNGAYISIAIPSVEELYVALASINNEGVLLGNYVDAAGLLYTFLATPKQ